MSQSNLKHGKIKDGQPARREKKPPRKITESYLHNAGLHYLQRFAAGTAHFRTVMMRKIDRSCHWHKDQNRAQCAEMLESLIEKFVDLGLLNDSAYARGMVVSLRRRGLSARMIHAKLSAKGLNSEQIKQALENYDEETMGERRHNVELSAALRLARRKKIGPYRRSDSREGAFERELGILARAGYGYDIAKQVVDMTAADLDNDSSLMQQL